MLLMPAKDSDKMIVFMELGTRINLNEFEFGNVYGKNLHLILFIPSLLCKPQNS